MKVHSSSLAKGIFAFYLDKDLNMIDAAVVFLFVDSSCCLFRSHFLFLLFALLGWSL